MIDKIVPLIILLFVVGLNCVVIILIRSNPEIISGFKMGDEPEQRDSNIMWVRLLLRYIHRANWITLICGIIGIVGKWQLIYLLSLIVPISCAILLAYGNKPTLVRKGNRKRGYFVALFTGIIILCLSVFYSWRRNLEVTFSGDKMEISGLYGMNIPIEDITQLTLCPSLPKIAIRTNGFAFGNTRLGHFRTEEGKNIILFTHSDSIFVRASKDDGTVFYISYRESEATKQLFLKIQDRLGKSVETEEGVADVGG
ncbi:MAG: hypothetical protein K2M85_09655 [Paramuribaculum sp.]|nr:hypothetical protein [Paramuribaculum sp.]